MKPHLVKKNGTWYCGFKFPFTHLAKIMLGHTPAEAFCGFKRVNPRYFGG